jgi:hypothetical protein
MGQSSAFAKVVAMVGNATVQWRRLQGTVDEQALGATPTIPAARPQGRLPTLKMPTAQGWTAGHKPTAAPGLQVNAFARAGFICCPTAMSPSPRRCNRPGSREPCSSTRWSAR